MAKIHNHSADSLTEVNLKRNMEMFAPKPIFTKPKIRITTQDVCRNGDGVKVDVFAQNLDDKTISANIEVGLDWYTTSSELLTHPLPSQNIKFLGGSTVNITWNIDDLDQFRLRNCRLSIRISDSVDGVVITEKRLGAFFFHADQPEKKTMSRQTAPLRVHNPTHEPVNAMIEVVAVNAPSGLLVSTWPAAGMELTLQPSEAVLGEMSHALRVEVEKGNSFQIVANLIDLATGQILVQEEFPYELDTTPPTIEKVATNVDKNMLNICVTAASEASPLHHIWAFYSTDQGQSWSTRSLAWDNGNMNSSTEFSTNLGPFCSGTKLNYRIFVRDESENTVTTSVVTETL